MSEWLNLHPKVAAGAIVAAVLYFIAPTLAAHGVVLDPTLTSLLAAYLTPGDK